MTKSRKVGIALAITLLLALLFASATPLAIFGNRNVAGAVTVTPRDEWANSYTGSYYDNLNTEKVGSAFRSDLASLITSTHKHQTSYKELATVFQTSDADPNKSGNIIWFYTGTSTSFSGSFGSSVGSTNREHVWAKNSGSTFPAETETGSDAHHLRPTEMQMNGYRSNYGFGEVTQSTGNAVKEAGSLSYGSTADELCYLASYNGSKLFYPAKGYRGATARILFYVQTRWGDAYNLNFVDGITTNDGKSIGKISDLMKWHLEEPPTEEEIRRNNAVAEIQGNRNPFIDHPEYAEMIYCNDGNSYNNTLKNIVEQCGSYINENVDPDLIPTSLTLNPSSLALTVGEQSQQISVTAQPSTASNKVKWTTSNASIATVSDTGVVTAKAKGTATITATSAYDKTVSASLTVTVSNVPLTGLTISESTLTLNTGTGKKLTVTPTPSNAIADVEWSSDNPNVATVDQSGYVTAKAEGTANITATSKEFPQISATATVTVKEAPKPTQIVITGTPDQTVYSNGSVFVPFGLTVTVHFSDNSSEVFTGQQLLSNFIWRDGTTGERTLSAGTTSVICQYGELEATYTGITVNEFSGAVQSFLDSLAKVESATTLREKFDAIKQAISDYNKMSPEEKVEQASNYAKLKAYAQSYNEEASSNNQAFSQAVELSASILVRRVSTSLAALIVIVGKALFGGK